MAASSRSSSRMPSAMAGTGCSGSPCRCATAALGIGPNCPRIGGASARRRRSRSAATAGSSETPSTQTVATPRSGSGTWGSGGSCRTRNVVVIVSGAVRVQSRQARRSAGACSAAKNNAPPVTRA